MAPEKAEVNGLDAHDDARAIVRLVQCSQCSKPLEDPMTLPCGNSICRTCFPSLHAREHVSYPDTPARQQGFSCPFPACGADHSLGDCGSDVTLRKVVNVFNTETDRFRPVTCDTPLLLEENFGWNESEHAERRVVPRSRVLHGGRLVATHTLASMGELSYDAGLSYQSASETGDDYRYLDVAVLEHLKEATRHELDCHVCYNIMLDPITTPCGHTFCQKCLDRVLDHSNLCPVCRRVLSMPPASHLKPKNKRLANLIMVLYPDVWAARAEAIATEEAAGLGGLLDTPLFVCTLSYPSMPTFLHIFEPRYRLMIRRAVERGNRKFGMVMANRTGAPQGELGPTQFMQYGTLLHIVSLELLPDGRSLIETIGVSRFKVKNWGVHDGYLVGKVERVEDIPLAEEERLEATETSQPPVPAHDPLGQLDRLSTRALLEVGTSFISKMRASSAPWLHEHVLAAYGNPPDDPALFPFWFASLLPISDQEKYNLIPITSVRERLKITARWIRRIEAQRWSVLFAHAE